MINSDGINTDDLETDGLDADDLITTDHDPTGEIPVTAAGLRGRETVVLADPRPDRSTTITVTVVGPQRRGVMELSRDVAVSGLASVLGAAVGVKRISRLSVDGTTIRPSQSLADVGLQSGAVLFVDVAGVPGLVPTEAAAGRPGPGRVMPYGVRAGTARARSNGAHVRGRGAQTGVSSARSIAGDTRGRVSSARARAAGVTANGLTAGGLRTRGVGAHGVKADGAGARKVGAGGLRANGVAANGIAARGVGARGVGARGVGARGVGANGGGHDGVGHDGVGNDGVGQDGVGAVGLRAVRVAPGAKAAPPSRPLRAEPARPKHGRSRAARRRITTRYAVVGGSVVALVVVSAVIGAALFGGGSSSPSSPSSPSVPDTAAVALATGAATAWVDGSTFTGPREAGVPADLGRTGPATGGTVEAVRSTSSDGLTNELFIVAPPAGTVYGLSVVVDRGRIAYPVTVSPVPFTVSIPAGGAVSVPETGRTIPSVATRQAQAWAEDVFGSPGHPAGRLGYGVAGAVEILREWKPTTGAAFVTRVRVPLAGTGPGRGVSRAVTAGRTAVSDEVQAVKAAEAAAAAATTTVAADQKALSKVTAVQHEAAAAAAAAAATSHPRRAAREAQDAATAQTAIAADQQTLTADQGLAAAAMSKLAAANRAAAAATATLGRAVATSSTVTSVYDVAYSRDGRAVAWVPADYLP